MPNLKQLLGTSNKKEQEKIVEQWQQLAQAPVLAVMVTYDTRNNLTEIRAAGIPQMPVDDVKFVLRKAIDSLTASQAQAQAQQPPQVKVVEEPPPEDEEPA